MTDQRNVVHIGGYTRESDGKGDGIVAARRDPRTGALTPLGTVAVTASPSFLVRHPTLPVLYAANELPEGQVSAWRIGPDGDLIPLGTGDTGGAEPCHLAVTPDGRHLVAANYGGGSVAVFPLDGAGVPTGRSDLVVHSGQGPDPERQEAAHAHMVSPDPDGGPLYVVDLGTDSVYRYDLDAATGRLVPCEPRARVQAGSGPRHLARHPDGRRVYLVGELDGTVTVLDRDAGGALRQRGRVPASARTGHVQPSEIAVGPQGRFLYVANRGVGTLAVFAIHGDLPELVAEVDTGGEWPRHFAWAGQDLYLADQRADMVRAFRVDPVTGVPEPAGEPVPVPSPSCVLL
ncbi:lactonase family protein [Micromonospora sp. NPDC023956]|uniref:lactonase family protein n=1 Tax=Micromonospora sp. NPDC023956 TaxID=3155722 RepID=UPI0033D1682B